MKGGFMVKHIIGFIVIIFMIVLYNSKACRSEDIILPIGGKVTSLVASWYGPNFQGMETASGETFDMYDYTCAHKDYPFGLWLKVTNTSNNETTFCLVNDRGPYVKGRDLDLSYAAAQEIQMVEQGVSEVRIEYIGIDIQYEDLMEAFKYYSLIQSF
jgi:rare lipoprotein A (peptidoglycan hydrolase)